MPVAPKPLDYSDNDNISLTKSIFRKYLKEKYSLETKN